MKTIELAGRHIQESPEVQNEKTLKKMTQQGFDE
jgi:hypothetical protein